MSEYRVGEIVDITIKGARVVDVLSGNVLHYTTQAGGESIEHSLHIGKGWPGHIVDRVAPAEWPPRPGDVWRDRQGFLFFAVESSSAIDMRGEADTGVSSTYVLKNYSPLTLVYRRESDGGQS